MKGHNPISVAHVHLNHPSIETKMVHRCQASLLSPTHSQYKLCRVPGGARDMQTASHWVTSCHPQSKQAINK